MSQQRDEIVKFIEQKIHEAQIEAQINLITKIANYPINKLNELTTLQQWISTFITESTEESEIDEITFQISRTNITDGTEVTEVTEVLPFPINDTKCLALTPKGKQCTIARKTNDKDADNELCFKHNQSKERGKPIIKVTDTDAVKQFFNKKQHQETDKRRLNNFKKETHPLTKDDLITKLPEPIPFKLPEKLPEFAPISTIMIKPKGTRYYEDSEGNLYDKEDNCNLVVQTTN